MKVTPFAAEAATGGVEDVRGEHTGDRYAVTARFAIYEPMLIPGPLQSPGCAESVQDFWHRHLCPGHGPAQRDAHVVAAVQRHAERSRVALGAVLDVVIEEAALRTAIGSPETLEAALGHLLELMRDTPGLSVAVIPSGIPRAVPPMPPFWVLDGELVALEVPSASLSEAGWNEVEAYEKLFARLREVAVAGYAARRLIMDAREQASRGC